VPIAEDSRVFDTFGTEIVHVDHEAVHLMPFVAMLHNFDSWYWQSFVQLDIDTNGNPVRADPAGLNLQSAGVLQDQTLLFFDVGVGYWLTDPDSEILPPIAATAELHYTTTLQDTDIVNGNGLAIRNFTNRYDVPNLTVGAHIKVSSDVSVRPAMVIPLKNGHDRHFDYEAMLQVNIAGR